jgi:hypothetical protein
MNHEGYFFRLVPWREICWPKSEGGLGLRFSDEANVALLLKWAVRFLCGRDGLVERILCDSYGSMVEVALRYLWLVDHPLFGIPLA